MAMVAVAAAMSLTAVADKPATAGAAAIGQPAPEFKLDDQTGKPVALSDHKGKIVVLEWTNIECPYVVRHTKSKTSATLAEKYKDKDVVWLQIDSTNSHNTATNLKTVTDNNLPFQILNDSQGTVGKKYGAKTTPHLFIVAKDGTLAYAGGMDNDPDGKNSASINYVAKALEELTAGQAVSTPETKSYGCSVKYAK
jgi:peroxiredoxin